MKNILFGILFLGSFSIYANVNFDLRIINLKNDNKKTGFAEANYRGVFESGYGYFPRTLTGEYCVQSINVIPTRENNATILGFTAKLANGDVVNAAIGAKSFYTGKINSIGLSRFEFVFNQLTLNIPNNIIESIESSINSVRNSAYSKAKQDIESSFEQLNYERVLAESLILYEVRCEDSEELDKAKKMLEKRLVDSLNFYTAINLVNRPTHGQQR